MNPQLMQIVIEFITFLETSSDDEVKPDIAVEQLESISYSLQQLAPENKAAFVAFCQDFANEARASATDQSRVEFLDQLPEAMGLN